MFMLDRNNKASSIRICEEILQSHSSGEDVSSEAVSSAYYALGQFSESENSLATSFEYYQKSIEAGGSTSKLAALLRSMCVNPTALKASFEEVIRILSTDQVKVVEDSGLGLGFSVNRIAELVKILVESEHDELVDTLYDCIEAHCLVGTDEFCSILLHASVILLNWQHFPSARRTLLRAQGLNRSHFRAADYFQVSRLLYVLDDANEQAAEIYFKGFQNYTIEVDPIDLNIFYKRVSRYLSDDDLQLASSYCDLIINLNTSSESSLNLLAIRYLKFKTMANGPEKLQYAYRIRDLLSDARRGSFPVQYLSQEMIGSINKGIEFYISQHQLIETFVRKDKRLGRNEKIIVKYLDGREVLTKFKYVKDDLKNGRCEIREVP